MNEIRERAVHAQTARGLVSNVIVVCGGNRHLSCGWRGASFILEFLDCSGATFLTHNESRAGVLYYERGINRGRAVPNWIIRPTEDLEAAIRAGQVAFVLAFHGGADSAALCRLATEHEVPILRVSRSYGAINGGASEAGD